MAALASDYTLGEAIGSRGNDWDGVFIEIIVADTENNKLRARVKEVDDNWKAPGIEGFMPGEEFDLIPYENWWIISDHDQERKFPWFTLEIKDGVKSFINYR